MKMNKTIFASLFVVCLLAMTSVGVFASADDTEASESIHYKEVSKQINFDSKGENDGADTINAAAGEKVCELNGNDLTFLKSVNLKLVGDTSTMFRIVRDDGHFNIILEDNVTVNLAGGEDCPWETLIILFCNNTDLSISGNGDFNIVATTPSVEDGKAYAINTNGDLIIGGPTCKTKMKIVAMDGIGLYMVVATGDTVLTMNNADVFIEGKNAIKTLGNTHKVTIYDNTNSTYKFEGTDVAFKGNIEFSDIHSGLFGSMSYRATNIETFNPDKINEYQYISTENNPTSVALIPAIIFFVIATVGLTYFVFFKPSRLPWQEEIYQAQVAKEKAERDALRAEQKRNADAIQAEIAQKRAIERKASEDRKAEELKRKEEERKVLEEKRAAERKEADERRAEENRRKEEEKRVLRERKEAEAKARAEAKAAEAKAAEERKAEEARKRDAERKALHEKKVAEAKAAEERRAEEARRKEAERKALHEKKLAEEKAKAEAKAKERAEKEAAKKK